jgi:putative sigma-54 modulation protein
MQLNLSGHHIEITSALRNYVTSKMERLERQFDSMTNLHVVLSVEKLRQKAEATLHVSGANLFANAEHEDMYAAIDALTDKLSRQVKKHKEKIKDHRQSEGGIKAQPIKSPSEDIDG